MNASNPLRNFRLNNIAKGAAGFVFSALLAMSATAQIAAGTTGIDATGNAQSEMAACNNGKTQQDRATCLIEVKNANAAKRAGKVDNAGGQFQANAMQRCNVLPSQDRVACEARVAGYGNPQGSVAGGGVITEIETVVVPNKAGPVTIQPKTSSDTILVIPAPQ
jgi:hypothetical protein